MKKVLGLLLVLSLVFTMCAFTASAENDLKIGVILVGDLSLIHISEPTRR